MEHHAAGFLRDGADHLRSCQHFLGGQRQRLPAQPRQPVENGSPHVRQTSIDMAAHVTIVHQDAQQRAIASHMLEIQHPREHRRLLQILHLGRRIEPGGQQRRHLTLQQRVEDVELGREIGIDQCLAGAGGSCQLFDGNREVALLDYDSRDGIQDVLATQRR